MSRCFGKGLDAFGNPCNYVRPVEPAVHTEGTAYNEKKWDATLRWDDRLEWVDTMPVSATVWTVGRRGSCIYPTARA